MAEFAQALMGRIQVQVMRSREPKVRGCLQSIFHLSDHEQAKMGHVFDRLHKAEYYRTKAVLESVVIEKKS